MYCTGIILLTAIVVTLIVFLQPPKEKVVPHPTVKVTVQPKYTAEEPFGGGGASPELDKPRNPYTLLDGLKPRLLGESPLAYINAEGCYARDYNSVHSLTGNYSKITNNIMPTYPDNCTGPRQEFTAAFYSLGRA